MLLKPHKYRIADCSSSVTHIYLTPATAHIYPAKCWRWRTGTSGPLGPAQMKKSPLTTSGLTGRWDWPPPSSPAESCGSLLTACWPSSVWSGSEPWWRRRCCTTGSEEQMPPPSRRRRRHSAASSWREGGREGVHHVIYTGIYDKCHQLPFFLCLRRCWVLDFLPVCCSLFSINSSFINSIRHSYDLISQLISII